MTVLKLSAESVEASAPSQFSQRRCRSCGCTDYSACSDPVSGRPCHWAEPGLCSVCADELESV